ncbi:MAG TPA: ATP synthase F1 subunit delta [Candidatus Methylomirabilis sp.]
MIAGALSKRYARALVDAVGGPAAPPAAAAEATAQNLEASGRDLEAFAQLLREHRDLRAFLANPGVQRGEKEAALARLTASLGLGAVVATFLRLLLERGRLVHFEVIVRMYRDLMDERLGRTRAEVSTGAPLDETTQGRLAERLAAVAGKTVVLDTKTDAGLLGGMVARMGGTVYDGSLRAQLARVREQLLRG